MKRVLLVASSGGHLLQLCQIKDVVEDVERLWVTFNRPDARSLLAGEQVVWAHHPTNRNVPNLLRNLRLATRVVKSFAPDVLISTGAGVAVPFAAAARLRRTRVVYIESFTRSEEPSLTGRLMQPLAHDLFVQWPSLQTRLRGAKYEGSLFDLP